MGGEEKASLLCDMVSRVEKLISKDSKWDVQRPKSPARAAKNYEVVVVVDFTRPLIALATPVHW